MSMITEQIKSLREAANIWYEFKVSDLLNKAADTIEQLAAKVRAANMERSTAYYNGGWIPVKERLPENKTYVLVTIGIPGRQPHARSGWYQDGFFHNDNGDVWRATDIEVKAWMPLPEPYREDGDTE